LSLQPMTVSVMNFDLRGGTRRGGDRGRSGSGDSIRSSRVGFGSRV
jgi:hypothetical protein